MENHQQQLTPDRILQMSWGYAPTLILEAALRNKVFDTLDAGPKSIAEVAQSTGASPRGLRALMNALVGLELLRKTTPDTYALTPESSAFLVSSKPSFMGGMAAHTSQQLIPSWLQLSTVVATGRPATSVNRQDGGEAFFQELVSNIFTMSYAPARALAAHLALGDSGAPFRVLDLGAGSGVWSIAIAQSSPRVQVTAIDFPGVLPITQKHADKFGVGDRYTMLPGDLGTVDFGRNFNLITIGHILHSEGVDRSKKLLRKCFDALAPGGTIAIQEFLVNPDRTGPPMGLIFGVNMLVNTDTGDTWSFEEIATWLTEAGFQNPRTLNTPGPSPLILADKP